MATSETVGEFVNRTFAGSSPEIKQAAAEFLNRTGLSDIALRNLQLARLAQKALGTRKTLTVIKNLPDVDSPIRLDPLDPKLEGAFVTVLANYPKTAAQLVTTAIEVGTYETLMNVHDEYLTRKSRDLVYPDNQQWLNELDTRAIRQHVTNHNGPLNDPAMGYFALLPQAPVDLVDAWFVARPNEARRLDKIVASDDALWSGAQWFIEHAPHSSALVELFNNERLLRPHLVEALEYEEVAANPTLRATVHSNPNFDINRAIDYVDYLMEHPEHDDCAYIIEFAAHPEMPPAFRCAVYTDSYIKEGTANANRYGQQSSDDGINWKALRYLKLDDALLTIVQPDKAIFPPEDVEPRVLDWLAEGGMLDIEDYMSLSDRGGELAAWVATTVTNDIGRVGHATEKRVFDAALAQFLSDAPSVDPNAITWTDLPGAQDIPKVAPPGIDRQRTLKYGEFTIRLIDTKRAKDALPMVVQTHFDKIFLRGDDSLSYVVQITGPNENEFYFSFDIVNSRLRGPQEAVGRYDRGRDTYSPHNGYDMNAVDAAQFALSTWTTAVQASVYEL